MFRDSPINIQTNAMDLEELENQIKNINELFKSEVDWNLFESIIMNAQNGQSPHSTSKNSYDMDGWQNHFKNQDLKIEPSKLQIEHVWKYIMNYHIGFLRKSYGEYAVNNSEISNLNKFQFEYIILKTLEL